MTIDLFTAQGESFSETAWDIYPRPQMRRDSFLSLNGEWQLTPSSCQEAYKIIVPFCPESLLSGVNKHFQDSATLCYKKSFTLPEGFNCGRVLLHIGACDQTTEIFLNKKPITKHIGGYTSITADITDALESDNQIEIFCTDNLRDKAMPYGKQTLKRGGMWYTPVSGIWQSVWLESVAERYIENIDIKVDLTSATITVTPPQEGVILCEGVEYKLADGVAVINPEKPRLWSPEQPILYDFTVITDTDRVESYFALRTIEDKIIDGIHRLCLNGEPYFFHGLLDQGYWQDGIYTPAHPSCYAEDILAMKSLGFNTLRKHIKVEAEEFYYQCDRLGMIVFQDMVNNGNYSFLRDTALPTIGLQRLPDKSMHKDERARSMFLQCMSETVAQLKNHPCILYWTIFNEGWGQFDSDKVYEIMKNFDDSRIIDSTSGWFRQKKSDVDSRHIYFTSWKALKKSDKPLVLSEFGGYALPIEGHLFNPDKAYGYKACKSVEHFQGAIAELYRSKVLPAIDRGLCAAIITQLSDVEDEINGFLTYDRKVNKADKQEMLAIAKELQLAIKR